MPNAIPTKKLWALFKNDDGVLKCRQIHLIDKVYAYFRLTDKNPVYCIPAKDIISKGTYKSMKKKYPEYLI